MKWFTRSREGNFNLSDESRPGRPSDCNKKAILSKSSFEKCTIKYFGTSRGFWDSKVNGTLHLKKMGMVNRSDVWVPHILTEKHLLTRFTACVSLLARHKELAFLNRIVTWDEKWISYNNVVRKRSWSLPSEPCQTAEKAGFHPKKAMLCILWDELLPMNKTNSRRGIVHNSTFWRPKLKKNSNRHGVNACLSQHVAEIERLWMRYSIRLCKK